MKLGQILYSQGSGTRRVCSGLVRAGLVSLTLGLSRDNEAVELLQQVQVDNAP